MVQDGSERALIKAKYGNDIRKAYISRSELEQLSTLENFVRNVFSISDEDLILLKYVDGDGDLISVTNEADIEVALRNERFLSFTVFTSGEDLRADIGRLQTEFGVLKTQLDKVSLALEANAATFEAKEEVHTRLSSPLTPGRRQELAESVATIEPSRHEQIDHNGVSHLVSATESASAIASESAQHTQEDFSQLYQQQQQEYASPPQEQQQQHQEFAAPPQQQQHEFQQPPQQQNDFQQPPPPQHHEFQPPTQQQQFQDYQQQQQQQQPPLETVPIDQGSQQQQFGAPPPSNGFGAPPQGFGVPPTPQQSQQQFGAPPPPQGFGVPPQPQFNNGISSPPSVDGRASIPPQHFQPGPPQGFNPQQPSNPGTPHHFQQQQQQPPIKSAPSPFPGSQFGPPPTSNFGPPPTGAQQFGAPPPAGPPQQQQFGAPPPSNGQQQFGAPPSFPGQQAPGASPAGPGQPPLGPPPSGLPIGPPPTFGNAPPTAGGLPNPFARQGQGFAPRPQFGQY